MRPSGELEKFDGVVKVPLAVPRDELKKREKVWQKKRAQKKRASPGLAAERPAL